MYRYEILSGILNLGLPDGTLPQLLAGARVFTALAVPSLTLTALEPWPLARVIAVIAGVGAIVCWANAVRANVGLAVLREERLDVEGDRRAVAHLVAEVAGRPVPPSRDQRSAA